VFAQQAAARGPVTALHVTGVLIAAIAAAGLLGTPLLPTAGNVMAYGT
jgi:hypothetical protein